MRCWFGLHTWTRWKKIVMVNNSTGNKFDMQERTCTVCGINKRRDF